MADAPLIAFSRTPRPDGRAALPLAELKKHLILWLPSPPGPKTVASILDAYFQVFEDRFVAYGSTAYGAERRRWDTAGRGRFFRVELPQLRARRDWGYWFSDGRTRGSWTLMIHGYRPATEPGRASFVRCEFDWELEPERLWAFAQALMSRVPCVSGTAGYLFQGQPRGPLGQASWNAIFGFARRYWGVDVLDVDTTAAHALDGLVGVSWLTMLGPELEARNPDAVEAARQAATDAVSGPGGTVLRAEAAPRLGDRNLGEDLSRYEALARALEPLQLQGHGSFADGYESRWDESVTQAWLRRFIDPARFADA